MLQVRESIKTLKLAGPIIFGELVQMALHIIDSAMVGAISYEHLAAAALVLSVINIPFVFCIGLTVAIAQMASMYNGIKKVYHVSHYFYNGTILCVSAAVIISLSLYFGSGIVHHLNQEPIVAELAEPFLKLLSLSIIPMILFMCCKQFADGVEYTKVAMVISFLGMPINVFINYLLIYGNFGFPRLELEGAGYGTLITRILMLVMIVFFLFRSKRFHIFWKDKSKIWFVSAKSLKSTMHIGVPTALQIVMESGAFAISGILVGMISSQAQAAHQIALSLASFTFMVSMGLAQAGSIRVSKYFGMENVPKIRQVGKSTLMMALIYGVICAIFYTIFRHQLPGFFNDDNQVIELAESLLILAAIFQIPDAIQAVGAGILRGMRDIRFPTIYIGIAYWLLGVPLGYLLAFHYNMNAQGIWIGFIIGLSFVAITLSVRFLKNVSKKKKE